MLCCSFIQMDWYIGKKKKWPHPLHPVTSLFGGFLIIVLQPPISRWLLTLWWRTSYRLRKIRRWLVKPCPSSGGWLNRGMLWEDLHPHRLVEYKEPLLCLKDALIPLFMVWYKHTVCDGVAKLNDEVVHVIYRYRTRVLRCKPWASMPKRYILTLHHFLFGLESKVTRSSVPSLTSLRTTEWCHRELR